MARLFGRARVAADVVCLGECMVELREARNGFLTRSWGGDTLNTAVYLARLGVPTRYASALGTDPFSDEMLAAWEAEGVGTELVARVPGRLPGLYLIRTDEKGERQFHYWRDSAPVRGLLDLPELPAIEAAVGRAGTLYFSGITLSLFGTAGRERFFALLERVRAAGVRVAFDTNFRPRGWPDPAEARAAFERAMRHADLVFAGIEDHALLHGEHEPGALRARIAALGVAEAVVKLATPACHVVAPGVGPGVGPGVDAVVEAGPVARVVDTTAAGDSFAAGYLAARLGGAGPVEAARAGHRLAGAVVGHPGAVIPRAAMPDATEDAGKDAIKDGQGGTA